MQRRGFTLVELSIVVVIMLMMASYLAVNYFSVSEARGNQEVRARMDKINEAILNYAATHKTGGRDVEVFNNRTPTATAVRVRWRIPAGRPYLPCPDITGDGLEDRVPPTATAITITVLTADSAVPGDYVLEKTGGCHSDRGALPWRTLNTPETDGWGNRFTYRVMPAFSSALTGFDQHARADTLPYRPLLTLAGHIIRADGRGGVQLAATFYDSDATQPSPWTRKFRIHPGPSLICDNAPCPHATSSTLIVGTLYADVSPPPGVKLPNHSDFEGLVLADFPTGAASGGAPFVVVSHGRNGYGAIRGNSGGGEEFVCNPFPRGDTRFLAEKQNAVWFNDIDLGTRAAGRFVCEAPGGTDSYNGIGFVDLPPHAPVEDNQGFDDIVRWLSVDEIVEGLSKRGALPVRLLPPIGLEKER